jgi:mitofilin
VEEPAGDATVITEDDMKAISDLLAEAVGAGGPLAATAVDTADAGAVLEGNEAGKASGGPGPELTPQDVNSEEGKMPEPEEAAPTEPGLSSTVGSSELPSPTSEPASVDTEAVAARRGTSSSSGALPRRTVEAVLELVSPADLVSRALKDGEDIGEQWELYGSMHRQAAADAEFVTEALKLVQGAYEGELGKVEAEAEAFEAMSQALEEKLVEVVRECGEAMSRTDEQARRELAEGLERQKKDLALAATLALIEERKDRIKQVDLLREQVNALHLAFQQRSEERKDSHSVHKIALGMLILGDALRRGDPVAEAAGLLHAGVGGDPLVEVALESLPGRALEEGVATREELQQWFLRVRSEVSKAALVPEAGGPLAHALSTLASALRIEERGAAGVEVAGVEGALARAETLVNAGELVEAADMLERHFAGSEGGRAAALWVQSVRDRVVVEQAAAMVSAHATALNAGLV